MLLKGVGRMMIVMARSLVVESPRREILAAVAL